MAVNDWFADFAKTNFSSEYSRGVLEKVTGETYGEENEEFFRTKFKEHKGKVRVFLSDMEEQNRRKITELFTDDVESYKVREACYSCRFYEMRNCKRRSPGDKGFPEVAFLEWCGEYERCSDRQLPERSDTATSETRIFLGPVEKTPEYQQLKNEIGKLRELERQIQIIQK